MHDLVERYLIDNRDKLYRLAYCYVKNREDALDIVSDAALKALQSRERLRDPAVVGTWMYRILVNAALDFLRARGRLQTVPEDLLEEQPAPEESADLDLRQAVDDLPEPDHTIIVLRFFEDMKLDDIAQALDRNVNTIKTRLYAALKKLRIQLEDSEERGMKHV